MTKSALFMEGINLMFSGMGFVIGFLIVLILLIRLMSTIITRFFMPVSPQSPPQPLPTAGDTTQLNDARLRSVISAAIIHHRRQQGLIK